MGALTNREPWRYFEDPATPDNEAAALVLLRSYMGPTFASSPDDATLTRILTRSVRFFERATRRFFVRRDGSFALDGNDAPRLQLPFPVIGADQTPGATLNGPLLDFSVVLFDNTTPEDATEYTVNDGAWDGPDDPRAAPFIEWKTDGPFTTQTSRPPRIHTGTRRYPYGIKVITCTGSWGYLDEDGYTPPLVREAISMLTVINNVSNDDSCAITDRNRGAIVSESTVDRGYTMAAHAISGGLTLNREIDQIIASFKRPPRVIISRPPRRRSRSLYWE